MKKSVLKPVLDILFPQHLKCHCCNREAEVNFYGICEDCEQKLLFSANDTNIDGIDAFYSALQYNDIARRAEISFKFNGAIYKKEFITHFIKIPDDWRFDAFVPVPLHKKRLKERGYNQSAVIAKVLSENSGIPVDETLITRIRATEAQTKLDRAARLKNVNGAFLATDECRGKNLVLVDDVRTTGSTLKECALELKKHGAAIVYALTAFSAMEEIIKGE